MLDTQTLESFIQTLQDSLQAQISVAFYDLETGQEFTYQARTMMHAASTMKVPVMIELFRQADAGTLSLDDSIRVKNRFASIVDGSSYSLTPESDSDAALFDKIGEKVPLRELIRRMIVRSSNLATNILIETAGAENVMHAMRSLGADTIQVRRGVEDLKAYRKGWNNRTNAYDLMVIMRAIAEGRAAAPQSCEAMIDILSGQEFRHKIPAGIPDSVRVANKTGSITAIDHDAAIVFPPGRKPYVLVVLTKGIADHARAQKAIEEISRRIFQQLAGRTL